MARKLNSGVANLILDGLFVRLHLPGMLGEGQALSTSEIAEAVGLHRCTLLPYLAELRDRGKLFSSRNCEGERGTTRVKWSLEPRESNSCSVEQWVKTLPIGKFFNASSLTSDEAERNRLQTRMCLAEKRGLIRKAFRGVYVRDGESEENET